MLSECMVVGRNSVKLKFNFTEFQEQRTAPRRRQVGVAPAVTWRVGGVLQSFVHVGRAQFPPRVYLLAVQSATNARTL